MNYYKTCVYGTKRVFERRNKILQKCYFKKTSYEWLYQDNLWIFSSCMYYNILVVKDTNAAL